MKKLEMNIPKPIHEIFAASAMTLFILFFIGLSIKNLAGGISVIPSAIWLVLVTCTLSTGIMVEGAGYLAVSILGNFTTDHFVCVHEELELTAVGFGFRILKIPLYYLYIPAERVVAVDWHTGQGSFHAGKDIDDWHVAFWYVKDPSTSRARHGKNPEVHIAGPTARKSVIAPFGTSLVEFLGNAGLEFSPNEEGNGYTRTGVQKE